MASDARYTLGMHGAALQEVGLLRKTDLRSWLIRLIRLGVLGWLLWAPGSGTAQTPPGATAAGGTDPAALLPFAELLAKQGGADGVVLAQTTGVSNDSPMMRRTIGIMGIEGWAIYETIATVTGTSPGPKFVVAEVDLGVALFRPGKVLMAWRKTSGGPVLSIPGRLKKSPAGLPLVTAKSYYLFDGVVIAAPQPQSKCPAPLPKVQTWANYQILSVAVGDPPAAPFALTLPCPAPDGPLPILWRRDPPPLGLGFLSAQPDRSKPPKLRQFIYPKNAQAAHGR